MTQYVLGVDGGGTKTQAAILDTAGRLCAVGVGGPSNYDDVGMETARMHIGHAVEAARRAAPHVASFAAAFLGMAGVVSPHDREVIRGIAHDLALAPSTFVGVDHDCRVALAGGLSGRPGIVLIVGTGSSCYGRNRAGQSWRAGGWGHLIADEGSGYWLGIAAMRAAVCAFDGRIETTPLMEQVIQHLHLDHMNDIMHLLYVIGKSRSEIAGLAPLVIEAARAGDHIARGLIQRAACDLADCVGAVADRLNFVNGYCEVVLVGGLFQAGDVFIQPLTAAIMKQLPQCRTRMPELPPVLGAGLLALELLKGPIDTAVVTAVRESASALGSFVT